MALAVLLAAAALLGACSARDEVGAYEGPLYEFEERRFRAVVEQPAPAAPDLRLRVEPLAGWKLSPRYPARISGERAAAADRRIAIQLGAADALRLDDEVLEFALPRPATGPDAAVPGLAATLSFAVCKGEVCERVKHPFELTLAD